LSANVSGETRRAWYAGCIAPGHRDIRRIGRPIRKELHMSLTRWSPAWGLVTSRDLFGIQDEVNRLFDTFNGRHPTRNAGTLSGFVPAIDIEELADEFVIRADLPGMSQKDVKVSLMGDTLTIRGERKQDISNEANPHRVERVFGQFERSFTLGTPVRNDRVRATYREGVLEIHVAKAEEAKLKEIEVQVA
jgi:HSP20 family protein